MTAPQSSGGFPLPSTLPPGDRLGRPRPITGPLAIWLLLQLAALFLAASRVPLSSRYPLAGERWAVQLLLFTQIVALAVLAPLLMRDWMTALATMLTGWPMLAAAAVLSAVAPGEAARAELVLMLWLVALTCWGKVFPGARGQGILAAIAIFWSLGGPVLWYLQGEFASPGNEVPLDWRFGPAFVALQALNPAEHQIGGWIFLASLMVAGAHAARFRRRTRHRQSEPATTLHHRS